MEEDTHFSLSPLHHCQVHKTRASLNKAYTFLHFIALAAIFYFRGSYIFNRNDPRYQRTPLTPWLITSIAELVLAFRWLIWQPYYYRPVTRTAFPERLPEEGMLPRVDVFVCTADPHREPTLKVMNTVISAMALDYPAEKLSVYLSDDAGAPVTLAGMKFAWAFAKFWLPFCKKYGVKTICPEAYFEDAQEGIESREFVEDMKMIKEKYEIFKQQIQRNATRGGVDSTAKTSPQDHPAVVQVINESSIEDEATTPNPEQHVSMPLLVYVAREKRPSHPHHFKGGALNALLRASSILSNAPYVLVLDCDMYCNDPTSTRQAMCFFLDPEVDSTLGWVQYPQKFHNVSEADIYDSQLRVFWSLYWPGLDGLQGPVISGTNFYIKRKALFGTDSYIGNDVKELRERFGPSSEFIRSLSQERHELNTTKARNPSSDHSVQEALFVASCAYERGTKWGTEVGFQHNTVMEDVMTGLYLQGKGWRSVYLNPPRPHFLGSAAIDLGETMTQGIRHYSGLLDIALSDKCPLLLGPSSRMQSLQKLALSTAAFLSIDCIPIVCFAIVPPLCLLYGIPLFSKASDPFFIPFAFTFIFSQAKYLCETLLIARGSTRSWLNEQRIWMVKGLTSQAYGTLACIMSRLGLRDLHFTPTNKVEDDDKAKYYRAGKYDFRLSNMFLVPLVAAVTLNLVCLVVGVARVMIVANDWDTMLPQVALSFYVLFMSLPVIEGMFLRKDSGRVPFLATLMSLVVSLVFLALGYFIILQY